VSIVLIELIAPRTRSPAAEPTNTQPPIFAENRSGCDSAIDRIAIEPML
jgi:hypothetical protein